MTLMVVLLIGLGLLLKKIENENENRMGMVLEIILWKYCLKCLARSKVLIASSIVPNLVKSFIKIS